MQEKGSKIIAKISTTEAENIFRNMPVTGRSIQQLLSGIDGVLDIGTAFGLELKNVSAMFED